MKHHNPPQNVNPEVTGREETGRDDSPRTPQADVDNHYEYKADVDDTTHESPQASSNQTSSLPNELTPENFTGLHTEHIKEAAGGVPAVLSSMKHAYSEMGAVRGTKTMLRLNQKNGFDCPGCAWPDPDGHRSHAEFCENGAKAVAEEATTKRITPEFFAQWSVQQLAEQSDFWLGKQGRLTHP
jgi:hypothetical protein